MFAAARPEAVEDWRAWVTEACVGCGKDAPPNLCSRCRCIAYCGPECQRAHWPLHKAGCVRTAGGDASPVQWLHTVWGLWDKGGLPAGALETRRASARLLPSTRTVVWSRAAVERLLDDDWRQLWPALPRGVCQADVARYLIAYRVGGIYLDADAELLQAPPGGDWKVLLMIEQRVPDARYLGPRESKHLVRMAQFMFATVPRHDFWQCVLQLSLSRCRQLLEAGHEWLDSDVLWATGPDVVTSVFHEKFSGDPSIEVKVAREFVRHECAGAWRKGADAARHDV